MINLPNGESSLTEYFPQMGVHTKQCRDVYEDGVRVGQWTAAREVYPNAESDVLIILATCLCTFCLILLVFMRKAKLSIEQMEIIRRDAATLMQIKEKELLSEQSQVRHLQCMHQEYITKCQKQLAHISALRKKRATLSQIVSDENGLFHERFKRISKMRTDWCQKKSLLRKSKNEATLIKLHSTHSINMFLASGICASFWISYNVGLTIGWDIC